MQAVSFLDKEVSPYGNHTHHAAAYRKGRTESRAISDIIDYVANPQKTDNGKLITSYGCDSRTADAEFLLAKRQYIAATGRRARYR